LPSDIPSCVVSTSKVLALSTVYTLFFSTHSNACIVKYGASSWYYVYKPGRYTSECSQYVMTSNQKNKFSLHFSTQTNMVDVPYSFVAAILLVLKINAGQRWQIGQIRKRWEGHKTIHDQILRKAKESSDGHQQSHGSNLLGSG
jgi:hypothetical protein